MNYFYKGKKTKDIKDALRQNPPTFVRGYVPHTQD